MPSSFKESPIEFNQNLLFPSNIFDLLASDHECYLYSELFAQIDISPLESNYSHLGQKAYSPKLITAILIYAYSRGVFSSREIERRCNEDLSFMYIAKMNCPNFRVLSDFRKDNAEFFHNCFKQTVQLAMELKLASLGHISLDGSKFKADSSKHKAMSYKRLKEKEQALTEEIEIIIEKASHCDKEENQKYKEQTGYEIPDDLQHKQGRLEKIKSAKEALEAREEELNPGKAIPDKKQISFADKEARIMGKNGNFDYQYNGQISVDEDNQIIVGQHVTQNSNDKQEVETAIAEIKETTGQLPDKMSADNGYMSGDNLEALEEEKIDVYIATNKGEKSHKEALDKTDRKLVKADFTYDEETNTFICPNQEILVMIGETKNGKRTYQANAAVCNNCSYKKRCCQSKKSGRRTITTDDKEPLRQKMNDKMETGEAKAIYKLRKQIVEPVFGQIKNIGFRRFSVRGMDKVSGEFSLICSVHNMKKIVKLILAGKVCQKSENIIESCI